MIHLAMIFIGKISADSAEPVPDISKFVKSEMHHNLHLNPSRVKLWPLPSKYLFFIEAIELVNVKLLN